MQMKQLQIKAIFYKQLKLKIVIAYENLVNKTILSCDLYILTKYSQGWYIIYSMTIKTKKKKYFYK